MNKVVWYSSVLVQLFVMLSPMTLCAATQPVRLPPAINVIFLDDGAASLPDGIEFRLNDWTRWERCLPTFIDALSLVGRFERGVAGCIEDSATIFGVEISERLVPERRNAYLIELLQEIQQKTQRPSAILARSTMGTEHLRFVVQDTVDYGPDSAVSFLEM
ncbi:hypothetical protein JW905_17880, partial [bacterium]|nr:hypothetical protein [candidate division CSSED10-310 bacterium]